MALQAQASSSLTVIPPGLAGRLSRGGPKTLHPSQDPRLASGALRKERLIQVERLKDYKETKPRPSSRPTEAMTVGGAPTGVKL